MPPKKSEQRKSDVSTARFAPIDDPTLAMSPASGAAGKDAGKPASAAGGQAASEGSASAQAPAAASQKKDAEKKDKTADREAAVTIEDMALPKSVITRLAKGALPPNTQIQGNAVLAMSKSATVFINYLATHANNHTVNAGKKTISPADVFKALEELELDFLKGPLEAEFDRFTAMQSEKRANSKSKAQAKPTKAGDSSVLSTTDADMADVSTNVEDRPRATKKQRVGTAGAGAAAGAAGAAAAAAAEADDAETEEDEQNVDEEDDEEDQEGEEEEEEEEDDEEQDEGSGDETQDAMEEREASDEPDEALDGDESD